MHGVKYVDAAAVSQDDGHINLYDRKEVWCFALNKKSCKNLLHLRHSSKVKTERNRNKTNNQMVLVTCSLKKY